MSFIDRIARPALVVVLLSSLVGCDDEANMPLYATVVEAKTLILGGGLATDPPAIVTFGTGKNAVELEAPGNVVAARATVTVSVVSGVVQRGKVPINNAGLFVEPAGLTFAAPVKVRQSVPPPPVGRGYSSVVVPDGQDAFVATTPARRIGGPMTDEATGEVLERWEGEGTGSGLWGLALSDPVTGADEGAGLVPGGETLTRPMTGGDDTSTGGDDTSTSR